MSLHFNTFSDNFDPDSEFFDNSLQQPYYDNVLNTTSDYVTVRNIKSTSTSNVQYHQASLQHDEHIQQNDFTPTPYHDNASVEVSIPKVSKRFDSTQNQILKIELEIVIKLQNDQTQQRTRYDVRSSTLPKNRTINRTNPYRKPNKQNFKNESNNDALAYSFMTVPQLNKSTAAYMQNVDNDHLSRPQFQQDNDSFRNNYVN
jgi:hypothetical protein